jgi:hypothetical protein
MQVETKKRNLSHILDSEVYVFGLTILKGCVDKTLSLDILGLDDLQKKAVETANGTRVNFRPVKVTAFEALNEAASSLQACREDIQSLMIFSGEYWFTQAAKMPQIHQICYGEYIRKRSRFSAKKRELFKTLGVVVPATSEDMIRLDTKGRAADHEKVQGIFKQIPIWKNYILENYDRDRQVSLQDLRNVLATLDGMTQLDKDAIVDRLEQSLPAREVVSNQIGAKIGICVRIPSLREQAKKDAELAADLASRETSEAAIRETQLAKQLQDEYANNIRESFQTAIANSMEEVYALIDDSLSRVSEVAQGGNITDTVKSKLLENISRLSTLSEFGDSPTITELIGKVSALNSDTATRNFGYQRSLQERIGQIRAELTSHVELVKSTGKGHKAISNWMMS